METLKAEDVMGYKESARQLLIATELITCIHGEDIVGEQPGITILYSEGTSFFRPFDSETEQREVWRALIEMRPEHFTLFDDILFDPADVARVELLVDDYGPPELIISFANHHFLNDQSFSQSDYTNLMDAYKELVDLLEDYQERHTRQAQWFIRSHMKH